MNDTRTSAAWIAVLLGACAGPLLAAFIAHLIGGAL